MDLLVELEKLPSEDQYDVNAIFTVCVFTCLVTNTK